MKKITFINKLLKKDTFTTKVKVFFSTTTYDAQYDPYEDNKTRTNLNPLTIKAYVTEISPEGLVWKSYGLQRMGAKEVICPSRYAEWFRKCNKIEIDNDTYEVYREGTGNRAIIQQRPHQLIRVVLEKKSD